MLCVFLTAAKGTLTDGRRTPAGALRRSDSGIITDGSVNIRRALFRRGKSCAFSCRLAPEAVPRKVLHRQPFRAAALLARLACPPCTRKNCRKRRRITASAQQRKNQRKGFPSVKPRRVRRRLGVSKGARDGSAAATRQGGKPPLTARIGDLCGYFSALPLGGSKGTRSVLPLRPDRGASFGKPPLTARIGGLCGYFSALPLGVSKGARDGSAAATR